MTRKIGNKKIVMIASIFVVALFIGTSMNPATAKMPSSSVEAVAEDEECKECSIAAMIAEALADKEDSECKDCDQAAIEAPAEPAPAEYCEDCNDAEAKPAVEYCEDCNDAAAFSSLRDASEKYQESDCKPCKLLELFGSTSDISELSAEEQDILAQAAEILSEHSSFGSDFGGFSASPLLDGSNAQSSGFIMGMALGGSTDQSALPMNGAGGSCGEACLLLAGQIASGIATAIINGFPQLRALAQALATLTLETVDAVRDLAQAARDWWNNGGNALVYAAVSSRINSFFASIQEYGVLLTLSVTAFKIGLIATVTTLAFGAVKTAILGVIVALTSPIAAAILTIRTMLSIPGVKLMVIGAIGITIAVVCSILDCISDEDENCFDNAAAPTYSYSAAPTYSYSAAPTANAASSSAGAMGMGANSAPGGMSL